MRRSKKLSRLDVIPLETTRTKNKVSSDILAVTVCYGKMSAMNRSHADEQVARLGLYFTSNIVLSQRIDMLVTTIFSRYDFLMLFKLNASTLEFQSLLKS